jgi:hypothetical protein
VFFPKAVPLLLRLGLGALMSWCGRNRSEFSSSGYNSAARIGLAGHQAGETRRGFTGAVEASRCRQCGAAARADHVAARVHMTPASVADASTHAVAFTMTSSMTDSAARRCTARSCPAACASTTGCSSASSAAPTAGEDRTRRQCNQRHDNQQLSIPAHISPPLLALHPLMTLCLGARGPKDEQRRPPRTGAARPGCRRSRGCSPGALYGSGPAGSARDWAGADRRAAPSRSPLASWPPAGPAANIGAEPDLAGSHDAIASEALARRARERHGDFLEQAARLKGRPLTIQEQNLWIAQAEQIGDL